MCQILSLVPEELCYLNLIQELKEGFIKYSREIGLRKDDCCTLWVGESNDQWDKGDHT